MRRLLARIAYRLLRPELDALTDPSVKAGWAHTEALRRLEESQRRQLVLIEQQGPQLEAMVKVLADSPSVRGLGGLKRY